MRCLIFTFPHLDFTEKQKKVFVSAKRPTFTKVFDFLVVPQKSSLSSRADVYIVIRFNELPAALFDSQLMQSVSLEFIASILWVCPRTDLCIL